ncbi:MAG: hypothetical protein KGK35_11590, partial [Xanthomonadaceae bacterium]|nr:hypothetical protein [Xanthomonadaceae bacterium]
MPVADAESVPAEAVVRNASSAAQPERDAAFPRNARQDANLQTNRTGRATACAEGKTSPSRASPRFTGEKNRARGLSVIQIYKHVHFYLAIQMEMVTNIQHQFHRDGDTRLLCEPERARMISAAHTVLSACVVSLCASALGLCVLVPISKPFGLLDYPDARKRHGFATPLVGGLSIFVGLLAGWMWLGQVQHFDDVV